MKYHVKVKRAFFEDKNGVFDEVKYYDFCNKINDFFKNPDKTVLISMDKDVEFVPLAIGGTRIVLAHYQRTRKGTAQYLRKKYRRK